MPILKSGILVFSHSFKGKVLAHNCVEARTAVFFFFLTYAII